ncbi:MAG: hypothetical protein NTX22_01755 [Ignavibacteriales bacterium]|nr:hypothetical protein [Ignavibacteriales bacterium]
MTEKLKEMEGSINKYELINKNILKRSEVEGKYIWDIGILAPEVSKKKILDLTKKSYKLFYWKDTLVCEKCYYLHLWSIAKEVGFKNVIILYNNKYEFMKKDFINSIFVENPIVIRRFAEIIIFVDSEGKILYAEFPEYGFSHSSENFYDIVKRYIKK